MTTNPPSLTRVGEAFCTSGTSPTPEAERPTTLHLVGPGQVGQAFLRLLPATPFRLIGLTDASATLHAKDGLDPALLADHKRRGHRLRELPGAEPLPVDLAIDLVGADVVVDATPSNPGHGEHATRRCLRILRHGKCLVLAAKDSLCDAGETLLAADNRDRVGIHAVLGGTGHALKTELLELRRDCKAVALVGNASTTAVIKTVERGGSIEDGIRRAQVAGVLEPDPELDLSGTDAAVKLAAVVRVLWHRDARLADVRRHDLRSLDPAELRRRYARGSTTRLVARAGRRPDSPLVAQFEEVPRSSVLAAPSDRVAYVYELAGGAHRVHIGHGIGPQGTAGALLHDVRILSATVGIPSATEVTP